MADIRKTIEIVFTAVDQTSDAFASVNSSLSGFGGITGHVDDLATSISRVTGPLSDLGDKAIKAETAVVAMAAAMLSLSIREAGKFQGAINEISTLTNMSAADLTAYSEEISRYARNSTQSLDSITGAVYAAISAGVEYTDAIGSLASAERLAVAGKADLNAATVLLASSLNAYGQSADQAGRFSDILFTTVRLGQTTIPELASSLAQVTSIAAAGGVPFETLNAAIAALTASGMPTSEAITSIKAALSNIISPSKQALELASELGIQFNATALATNGFEGVLRDVQTATGGSIEQMSTLFGSVRALAGAASLAADQSGVFSRALDEMGNSAGATEAAYQKMAENFALINQRLVNNLRVTLIEAGTPLLNDYADVANALARVFEGLSFGLRSDAFRPVFEALEKAAQGLAVYLAGVAQALPDAFDRVDFSRFIAAFEGLGKELGGLFGGLDLTKPEDLAKAIQFVANAVAALTNVVSGLATAWQPWFQRIADLVDRFSQLDQSTLSTAGQILGLAQVFEKIFSPLISGVTGAVGGLTNAFSLLATMMAGKLAVDAVGGAVAGFTRLVPLLAATGPVGVVGAATAAVIGLGSLYSKLRETESAEEFERRMEAMRAATERTRKEMEEFGAWKPGQRTLEELGEASQETADAIARLSAEAAKELPFDQYERQVRGLGMWDSALDLINANLAEHGKVLLETGEIVDAAAARFDKFGNVIGASRLIIDEATGAVIGYQGAFEGLTEAEQEAVRTGRALQGQIESGHESIAKSAAEAEKAAEATRKWNEMIAQMQHAERLKIIESQTAITTTRIQADAQKWVAAFDSVTASVASTGDTLTGLYGTLGSGDLDRMQQLGLEREIQRESTRRDEVLQLQKEMTKAQIDEMRARTAALERGDALIRIEGDGLAPHLEAFMWEILRAIQVRVNADGMDMLLGVER